MNPSAPAKVRSSARPALAALALVLSAACATTGRPGADGGRAAERACLPHSAADVDFMSKMIPHHAQAVRMAGWASTHEASPDVRTLSERILVSQRDEIAFMERWLEERCQPLPDEDSSHGHTAAGTDHRMPAPGMLTPEQLGQLDRARGREFDRLFLTFMIQHHQGALAMVEELFRAQGAVQDETTFRFAADVQADQVAEIERMSRMLAAMSAEER